MPFTKPPLDGTLTFPELFDFHWFHNPEHPLFKYERHVDGMTGEVEVEVVSWSRAVRAIHNAAGYVERVCTDEFGGSAVPPGGIVAILANIDTFSYYVLIGGVMRAGFVPFTISPRNTPPAVLHLLHSTGARHILASSDPGVQRLTEGVIHANNIHQGHHGPSSQGGSVPNSPLHPAPSPWLVSSGASPLTPVSAASLSGQPWSSPGGESLQFFPVPTFEYLFDGFDETFEPPRPIPHAPSDGVAVIGHSSGTTGLPKAHRLTTAIMLSQARHLHQDDDFSTSVWSCHSIPMSHTMGVCIMAWSVLSGYTITSFPPDTIHIVPSPERILASACASGSDTMICLPSCLETGSRSPQWVDRLKSFKQVLYAGAPLYTETGDYLTSQGVKLRPIYGATECGIVLDIRAQHDGNLDDWEYFQFSSHLQTEFRPFHDDVFELLISSETLKRSSPSVLTSEYNGQMMYNTLDLMQRHPTKPNWWKVYGRSDEQLTHSTVERTNPAPIELRLRKHPKIANAVVFGHGRLLPGVIVDIVREHQVDPSSHAEKQKLCNEIWFYMDQINDFLPVHSRIVKEMMIIADPAKPLSNNVNAKGLIRRAQALAAYEAEIEEAYATAHLSTPLNLPCRDAWELDECLGLVRKVVKDVLSGSCTNWPGDFGPERSSSAPESQDVRTNADVLDDDTDLISTVGLNSIQVAYIQQTILSALHHGAKISRRRVPFNFVYANPTIRTVGEFIMKVIVQGHGLIGGSLVGKRVAEMEEYVKRYTVDVDKRAPKGRKRDRRRAVGVVGAQGAEAGEVVMLTGSTGALGAHILEELVKYSGVVRVYAVNRPDRRRRCRLSTATSLDDVEWSKPRTSGERHEDVFQTFGLDALILLNDKVKFVEADLDAEHLDLDRDLYMQLQREVTCIIHAAWPSNPNIHLASFEPMLAGTRNLLDFALGSPLRSPPRFVFLSTLHIFSNWVGGPRSPESANTRPGSALGQGYAESNWIAERIIDQVAQKHSPVLPCTIVRLGHICASRNGVWGKKHCMTALAKSVLEVGCMPRPQGDVTWIPMHHAAAAIVEIALPRTPSTTGSTLRYLNLTHPRPVSADLLFSSLSRHLGGCDTVSYEEWLAALQSASCLAPSSNISASSSQSSSSSQLSSALLAGSIGCSLDTFIQRLHANPAGLHLLDFFRSLYKPVKPYSRDTEAFGFPLADNEKAVEAAPNTLGTLKELDVEREVVAWVKGWKGSGCF